MDLQFLQFPAVMWFSFAFVAELLVTGKAFLNKHALVDDKRIKYSGVTILGLMSVWNVYAAIEVQRNAALSDALITKFGFSFAGFCLQLWVLAVLLRKAKLK